MSLAQFVDPKCKKQVTQIFIPKILHQRIIVFTCRTTIKVFTGWLTLRMSSTSRRIMIYPIIFLLGYYFIQVLNKYYKSFKKLTIAFQINYQLETRLMCRALNLTDAGPTADLIFVADIRDYIPWRKICHVEKFQISVKNLNNLWSFIEIYAFLSDPSSIIGNACQ